MTSLLFFTFLRLYLNTLRLVGLPVKDLPADGLLANDLPANQNLSLLDLTFSIY